MSAFENWNPRVIWHLPFDTLLMTFVLTFWEMNFILTFFSFLVWPSLWGCSNQYELDISQWNSMGVCVRLGCYNKRPWTRQLRNNRIVVYSSGGWEFQGQDSGSFHVWWELSSSFVDSCLLLVPSHGGRRGRQTLLGSLIRALIPLVKAPPSWPNHPERPHLQIAARWGWGLNIWICRDTDIQSLAVDSFNYLLLSAHTPNTCTLWKQRNLLFIVHLQTYPSPWPDACSQRTPDHAVTCLLLCTLPTVPRAVLYSP